jgi:hypothetical protein
VPTRWLTTTTVVNARIARVRRAHALVDHHHGGQGAHRAPAAPMHWLTTTTVVDAQIACGKVAP